MKKNGIGFYVEEMTKDEFDSFGKKWIWAASPSASENVEHSFRNYMRQCKLKCVKFSFVGQRRRPGPPTLTADLSMPSKNSK